MKTGRILLLCLLGADAWQDLRKREILLLPTLLYGCIRLWLDLLGGRDGNQLVWALVPGLFLLVLSCLSGGSVGAGDAWVVLAAGPELGFFPTFLVLWGSLLLVCGWSFAVLLRKKERRIEVPMVPFLFLTTAVMELWILVGL